jgi:hypothetical protein
VSKEDRQRKEQLQREAKANKLRQKAVADQVAAQRKQQEKREQDERLAYAKKLRDRLDRDRAELKKRKDK